MAVRGGSLLPHRTGAAGRYGVSDPATTLDEEGRALMVTVNVVLLAGTVSADPVTRRMPSGDEVTELRISVPETGRRLLPPPGRGVHVSLDVV